MNSDYLFVYGTLQNDVNTEMSQFLSQHSKIIGIGYMLGKLYAISWFPGAVLSEDTSEKIHGTLFKLNDTSKIFKTLDYYEGCDINKQKESLFIRGITTVFLENGTTVNSWVYIYNQNVANKKRILSGDFLKDA